MKILIIPDVHGSHEWEIAKEKINEADKIVFLGDSFDSWSNIWDDQGENFKNICDFKRKYPDKVKLLIGNHDFAYISGTREGDRVSGHQYSKHAEIRALLTANLDILDLAFEADGFVFSHAGFSKTWVRYMKRVFHEMFDKYPDDEGRTEFESQEDFEQYKAKVESSALIWDENEWSISKLNEVWHTLSHFPGDENFIYGFDELLDWHGCFSGSGNEVTQGPLWIRPEALLDDAYYPKQVVGHTEYCIDNYCALKKGDNYLLVADSPSHAVMEVFDTENPPAAETILDYEKFYKRAKKSINAVKSNVGILTLAEDNKDPVAKKELIMQYLSQYFDDKAEIVYKNFFKEED